MPRSEDVSSSELEGIFAEPVLAVSGALGAGARFRVLAAEKMKQVCGFQFRDLVSGASGIDQQRKRDPGLLAKQAGIVQITQADCGQGGSGLLDFGLVFAQLRDMLAAEDSTVVPQKNNDGWIPLPERSEADLRATRFGQRDVCELRAERFRHSQIVSECEKAYPARR